MISGLNHVTFSVSDLERSFLFYKDILGLRPVARWYKGAHFLAGEQWICLNLEKPEPAPHENARYSHVAFSVAEADYNVAVDSLVQAGAKCWQQNHSEGNSFYFLDPDGHKLEIHTTNLVDRLEALKLQPPQDFELYENALRETFHGHHRNRRTGAYRS